MERIMRLECVTALHRPVPIASRDSHVACNNWPQQMRPNGRLRRSTTPVRSSRCGSPGFVHGLERSSPVARTGTRAQPRCVCGQGDLFEVMIRCDIEVNRPVRLWTHTGVCWTASTQCWSPQMARLRRHPSGPFRVSAPERRRSRSPLDRSDPVPLDRSCPGFVQDRPAREQLTVAREAHNCGIARHRTHGVATQDRFRPCLWGVQVSHCPSTGTRLMVMQFDADDCVGVGSRLSAALLRRHSATEPGCTGTLVGLVECDDPPLTLRTKRFGCHPHPRS